MSPLVAIEAVCRCVGWGAPQRYADPFVGFSATRPLFVRSADGARYEIAANRLTHFQPDWFAAEKPADEFRIFCLGGSTVQGRPYSIETSFTTWLELSLQAADPSRTWRVVNCGGVSYATYRLVPVLEEVLEHDPDLVVFYEGHNEFLEDRTYAPIKHAPRWFTWAHERAASLRTYNVLRSLLRSDDEQAALRSRTLLGPEVDARLDWKDGLAAYHRDPDWQRDVVEHFAFNLRRIAALSRARGVPLVLVNPASNLDWPPFKSESRDDLNVMQRKEIERLRAEAAARYRTDPREASRLLAAAAAIDDLDAGLQFDLGKSLLNLGEFAAARAALVRAKDLDVCPLRILEPMNRIVLDVARETGTPLVDADALFSAVSPGGVNGAKWFVDHVHPNVEGHQLLADALAEELVRLGVVNPVADWPARRRSAYDERFRTLPANYFPAGAGRLRGEQAWARGQMQRPRTAAEKDRDD